MNIVDAHDTARNAAERFGKPFKVYRLKGWPIAVFGATSIDLPSEAEILATYPEVDVRLKPDTAEPTAPVDAQGSLF